MPSPKLTVISLGAGVQSTTMALMAAKGEITPMPDCAIFADTGWEPKAVYKHLDWLEAELPFPVHRVSRPGPNLGEMAIEIARSPVTRTAMPPYFTKDPMGMLPRQCTKEFKVRVISRKIRELLGHERVPKGVFVEVWIGISTDEMTRMKEAESPWIKHRWPLVEARIHRHQCLGWLDRNNYPTPPKSACIFCPYHGADQWRAVLADPEDRERLIAFDKAIRPGFHGMDGEAYLHPQRVPIDQVDLSTPEDHGQLSFLGECDGMCGV